MGSGRPLSAMIAGSPGIQTAAYSSLDEARKIIEAFIRKTAEGVPGFFRVSK
jgi:hypothetical protein